MAKKVKEQKKKDDKSLEKTDLPEEMETEIEEGSQKVTAKEVPTKASLLASRKDPSLSIRDTLDAIRTKFGDESIMKLGEKPKVNINAIPTGSIGLDAALGVGGNLCGP